MPIYPTNQNIKNYWNEQQPIFSQIYSIKMGKYIKTLSGPERAFMLTDWDLRCIDERMPGGVHLAGSGILMTEEQLSKTLNDLKISSVWTHAECGAAKLYAQKNGLDPSKSDDYAQAWGKKLAQQFGLKYSGHLSPKPSGLHIARLAYYDGTGTFDFQKINGLPPGFIISRKYIESAYALVELEVAISIATGNHGFGDLITEKNPFLIVPISDSHSANLSLDALITELKPLAENNPLIIIDGFTSSHLNITKQEINIPQYI